MIARIVVDLLQVYLVLVLVRVFMTWIPVNPWSKLNRPIGWLYAITDPVLRPLRKLIPPLRLGGSMLIDLSPIVLIIVIEVVIGIFGGSHFLP